MGVSVSPTLPSDLSPYVCIVDAVFGFSFKGANNIRAPFDTIIPALVNSTVPVASVDVPSGFPFAIFFVAIFFAILQFRFYFTLL